MFAPDPFFDSINTTGADCFPRRVKVSASYQLGGKMPHLRESAGGRTDIGDGLSDVLNSADRGETSHRRRIGRSICQKRKKTRVFLLL